MAEDAATDKDIGLAVVFGALALAAAGVQLTTEGTTAAYA